MNDAERNTFDLGPTDAFDEGFIATISHFWYVRQYNKDKPENLHINLFVLADITHYFIRHIDVYQINNVENIDIYMQDLLIYKQHLNQVLMESLL